MCVGGPKWAQICYPVAWYLQTVRGPHGKTIGTFATFGGRPLPVFEVELAEKPMARLLGQMGAVVTAIVCVSGALHEASVLPIFKLVSRLRFSRTIDDFKLAARTRRTASGTSAMTWSRCRASRTIRARIAPERRLPGGPDQHRKFEAG